MDDLVSGIDVISIHAPLTREMFHMIGESDLEMTRGEMIIINTAREQIIDEIALINALENGIIAGAGFDVMHEEPPAPANPLFNNNRVVITPHVAWYTEESLLRLRDNGLDEVVGPFKGKDRGI